jgi:hypothetical protein
MAKGLTPGEAAAMLRRFRFGIVASETMDEVAPGVVGAMRLFAPKGRREAGKPKKRTLEDSFYPVRHTSTTGAELSIVSNVPYAKYVLKGTKPHAITGKPLLAFMWNSGTPAWMAATGGKNVLTILRSVQHPGTKANRFDLKAWAQVRPGVAAAFRERITKEFAL